MPSQCRSVRPRSAVPDEALRIAVRVVCVPPAGLHRSSVTTHDKELHMLKTIARLALVPLALALASTSLLAPPQSGAVTGRNIVDDFEHPYVGLVAFYDADGVFLHRCTGTLLSPEVFLTAGHCVAADDEGNVAPLARIWFEQDAGVGYDPATGTPAPSGYPVSGGVTSTMLYNYGFTDLTTIPETHDVGLIVLPSGAVEAKYPDIDTYGTLAGVGDANLLGTGQDAV